MTAAEFRAYRKRLGMTQAELARALGLTARADGTTADAVRHYERGSRKIPETVARLCRYIEKYGVLG